MSDLEKSFLPVTLDLTGKTILLVGSGESAYKKLKILLRFTNNIIVLAKKPIEAMRKTGVKIIIDKYHVSYLVGKDIVYASTDDLELDTQIMNDCHHHRILVNVHDRPDLCDFVSPAVYQNGNVTVAVGSNATDVFLSIKLRDMIKEFLEKEYFNQTNHE